MDLFKLVIKRYIFFFMNVPTFISSLGHNFFLSPWSSSTNIFYMCIFFTSVEEGISFMTLFPLAQGDSFLFFYSEGSIPSVAWEVNTCHLMNQRYHHAYWTLPMLLLIMNAHSKNQKKKKLMHTQFLKSKSEEFLYSFHWKRFS